MKLLKTLTNKRKTKIIRATAIIMTIVSAIFLVTTAIWKVKTGFYIDNLRTNSFNTNATVAVASAAVAVTSSGIALFFSYKNKQLLPLLLLIFTALALLLAFIMPLKDQKTFSEQMDIRYATNDLMKSMSSEKYFEWAQTSFYDGGFWFAEAHHLYTDQTMIDNIIAASMIAPADWKDPSGLSSVDAAGVQAAKAALSDFVGQLKLVANHGLVSAKASLHTANIAILWTGVGLVALAFFLNYYKAVDARTVTIQMPVKSTKTATKAKTAKKAPAKKAPAKKATKAKK